MHQPIIVAIHFTSEERERGREEKRVRRGKGGGRRDIYLIPII